MDSGDIVIALAGNPNSGKTSLFNFITGSRQHVANYPGVTIDKKEGEVRIDDADVIFIDLPGTYSLSPYSPEEYIALKEIISDRISSIIVVVDTTRLFRNLYLVSQILETRKPIVVALNMFDEFEASGNTLNEMFLSEILGVPCVKTVGNRGKGVTELMSTALKAARGEIHARGKPLAYSHEMEHSIDEISRLIHYKVPFNERWSAITLLHYGKSFPATALHSSLTDDDYAIVDTIRKKLESIEGKDIHSIVTSGRYGFSKGALAECLVENIQSISTFSDKLDTVLTHRWLGIPIFFAILWLMFQATFSFGQIPMGLIEGLFSWFGGCMVKVLPEGFLRSLVIDGVIAGVGGVLVFLPNILILFLCISMLEDTGYMARAAFIMDRLMHAIGLHGKSFIPMLVGFGCAVPAIMATRTLESRRDRLITMFIIPFMSCGARLPAYTLLAGAFFGPHHAGTVIFSIYCIGIIIAFGAAKLISMFTISSSPFVIELPPYRIPTIRSVVLHIWERAWMYLRKAGTIILGFSVIMWLLMSFPKPPRETEPHTEAMASYPDKHLSYSFVGRFGRLIEPVLQPLGFTWKTGIVLTAGFAAKEVIVSSLATIYSISHSEGDTSLNRSLSNAMRKDPSMNPLQAYALMLFILLYTPCVAMLVVLKKEAGGWLWAALMVLYTCSLAWVVTFLFINAVKLFVYYY